MYGPSQNPHHPPHPNHRQKKDTPGVCAWGVEAAVGTAGLACAVGGVLGDRIDVARVDECRAGEHGCAAADGVAVVDVQPQRVDGEVALQEGLLIDGPSDVAVLDRADQFGIGVEGVDDGACCLRSSSTAPSSGRWRRPGR